MPTLIYKRADSEVIQKHIKIVKRYLESIVLYEYNIGTKFLNATTSILFLEVYFENIMNSLGKTMHN